MPEDAWSDEAAQAQSVGPETPAEEQPTATGEPTEVWLRVVTRSADRFVVPDANVELVDTEFRPVPADKVEAVLSSALASGVQLIEKGDEG